MLLQYIKKEDVHDIPNQQRKITGIIILSFGVISAIFWKMVLPDLLAIYTDLSVALPWHLANSTAIFLSIAGICLCIGAYVLRTSPNYEKADRIAADYKPGEMIKTRLLTDKRIEIVVFLLTAIWISFIVITIVTPLYGLTDTSVQTEIDAINAILDS